MSKFPELQAMLEGNRQWSEAVDAKEPEFFATSAKGQVSLRRDMLNAALILGR